MAAGGGGAIKDPQEDDSHILESLKEAFRKIPPKGQVTLSLFIKTDTGKEYTTELLVENLAETNEEPVKLYLYNHNYCLLIRYDLQTSIRANSKEHKCFDPILVSNSPLTPNKLTSTDILQVLKTKLLLTLPYIVSPFQGNLIYLIDAAKKDSISLSPFKMLRGQPPLYQKYGYFNQEYTDLLKFIKKLKFGDLIEINASVYEFLKSKYKRKDKVNPPLTQVFQNISFEDAIQNKKEGKFDEEEIFNKIFTFWKQRKENISENILITDPLYIFNETSEEWQKWNSRILIDNWEIIHPTPQLGMGRRKTRKRQYKLKKRRSYRSK